MTLFSKSPYLTAHIKINYETSCIGKFSEKHRDVSRIITTANMELFVALLNLCGIANFGKKTLKFI